MWATLSRYPIKSSFHGHGFASQIGIASQFCPWPPRPSFHNPGNLFANGAHLHDRCYASAKRVALIVVNYGDESGKQSVNVSLDYVRINRANSISRKAKQSSPRNPNAEAGCAS